MVGQRNEIPSKSALIKARARESRSTVCKPPILEWALQKLSLQCVPPIDSIYTQYVIKMLGMEGVFESDVLDSFFSFACRFFECGPAKGPLYPDDGTH